MITISEKKNCVGCNACGDICYSDAISFEVDNEGFWYPRVNKEKCVNCGIDEDIKYFSLKDNGFKCSSCGKADKSCIEILPATVDAIKYITLDLFLFFFLCIIINEVYL